MRTADGAVQRWRAAGGPVALKAEATGLLHKAAAGGVVLDVDSEDGVRAAVGRFAARFGDTLRGVLVQPMVSGGDEVLVGATVDAVVGPVLTVGPGGAPPTRSADGATCSPSPPPTTPTAPSPTPRSGRGWPRRAAPRSATCCCGGAG
nr:acetate--CoA ligase family protein [Pseudonocardia sp. AL041005-10]